MAADHVHLPVLATESAREPEPAAFEPGNGRRHHPVRARTISMRRFAMRDLRALAEEYPEQPGRDYRRPATFADCEREGLGDTVPCPYVSCSHHIAVDVTAAGNIKLNFPDGDPIDIAHTCSLRVAENGGATLEEIAAAMNITRERVRQLEGQALRKIRAAFGDDFVRDLLGGLVELEARR